MTTDEYAPSDDEEGALVDLLGMIIEDVNDEPQFTVSEHALMAAGTIRREWLAAHDARVRRDAVEAEFSTVVKEMQRRESRPDYDGIYLARSIIADHLDDYRTRETP